MRRSTASKAFLLLIASSVVVGAILYPQLPERIASHWNARGEADGTMGKFRGVFLLPMISAALFVLYIVIPKIDPLKKNITAFRKSYDAFWTALFLYMTYVYALLLAWNLGARFDFTKAIVPAFAMLFYVIGAVLKQARRNWFFGIRTPWTMSNDLVWKKTHALGATLFKISAMITLLGLFFGGMIALLLMLIPILATSAALIVYSYLEYRKLPPEGVK